jgi:hypothetical protein
MTTKNTLTGRTDLDVTDAPWTDPDGNKWLVPLEWKTTGDQLVGVAIRALGDTSPTATLIRKVPFGQIINAERARRIDRGEERSKVDLEESLASGGPNRGRHLTDTDLQAVAHFYEEAYEAGLPVQRHIADKFGVSIPTAARRISRARQRGFIDDRFVQTRGRVLSSKE